MKGIDLIKNEFSISEYRYERKFRVTNLNKYEVENSILFHPYFFKEIFHERFINNIYFDTLKYRCLHDNLEGAANRMKIRIRWYGDLFGSIKKPVLEIKNKKGSVGNKMSSAMRSFDFSKDTDIKMLPNFTNYQFEDTDIDFASLIPSILNRYKRKYFMSYDGKYRITIDTEQEFFKIKKDKNNFLESYQDDESVIVELKYNIDDNEECKYITSLFPFRLTKNSKYVNGLEKILNINF